MNLLSQLSELTELTLTSYKQGLAKWLAHLLLVLTLTLFLGLFSLGALLLHTVAKPWQLALIAQLAILVAIGSLLSLWFFRDKKIKQILVLENQNIELQKIIKNFKTAISVVNSSPKFIKKYGVLWDNEGNPHCASHEILIRRGDPHSITEWFVCPNCTTKNSAIYLTDEDGKPILFSVACKKVLASYKT